MSGFLSIHYPAPESSQRAFVKFMSGLAEYLGREKQHEKSELFVALQLYNGNFHFALKLGLALKMTQDVAILTLSLAAFAQYTRNFVEAIRLYESLRT